jgi:hypothetical protein
MSLRWDFRPLAMQKENLPPESEVQEAAVSGDSVSLERRFWKNVMISEAPLYGADVEGSLFDKDLKVGCLECPACVLHPAFAAFSICPILHVWRPRLCRSAPLPAT